MLAHAAHKGRFSAVWKRKEISPLLYGRAWTRAHTHTQPAHTTTACPPTPIAAYIEKKSTGAAAAGCGAPRASGWVDATRTGGGMGPSENGKWFQAAAGAGAATTGAPRPPPAPAPALAVPARYTGVENGGAGTAAGEATLAGAAAAPAAAGASCHGSNNKPASACARRARDTDNTVKRSPIAAARPGRALTDAAAAGPAPPEAAPPAATPGAMGAGRRTDAEAGGAASAQLPPAALAGAGSKLRRDTLHTITPSQTGTCAESSTTSSQTVPARARARGQGRRR